MVDWMLLCSSAMKLWKAIVYYEPNKELKELYWKNIIGNHRYIYQQLQCSFVLHRSLCGGVTILQRPFPQGNYYHPAGDTWRLACNSIGWHMAKTALLLSDNPLARLWEQVLYANEQRDPRRSGEKFVQVSNAFKIMRKQTDKEAK